MKNLDRLETALLAAERALIIGIVVFMTGLAFTQVVLRSIFSLGFLWADTLLRHLVLWVGFLGAAMAATSGRQFALDAGPKLLRPTARAWAGVLAALFSAAVSAAMARASWSYFQYEYARDATLFSIGETGVPGWIFEIILPVGFVLLSLHYLLLACRSARPRDGESRGSPWA